MNCDKAREIINHVIDGEGHRAAERAYHHISHCNDCMQWLSSMERMLDIIASANDLPTVDLSESILASLPQTHPATGRTVARLRRRLVAWVVAFGVLFSAAVTLATIFILDILSSNYTVLLSFEIGKPYNNCVAIVSRMFTNLADLTMLALRTHRMIAMCVYPAVIRLLLLDITLLLGVAALCFCTRKRMSSGIMI